MGSRVVCPGCGQAVAVPASSAGKQLRCPHCRQIFSAVPATTLQADVPTANPFLRPKPPEEKKEKQPVPAVDTKLLLAGALVVTTVFLPIGLFVAFRLASPSSSPAEPRQSTASAQNTAALSGTAAVTNTDAATNTGSAASSAGAVLGTSTPVAPTAVRPGMPISGGASAIPMPAAPAPNLSGPPPGNVPAGLGVPPGVPPSTVPSASQPPAAAVTSTAPPPLQTSPTELVAQIEPSVVVVDTGRGMGSGFIYDQAGTIVTNYHVIEGAKKAVIRFADKPINRRPTLPATWRSPWARIWRSCGLTRLAGP